ncbi:MAG: hypothetical protein SA339_12125 [Methanomassiliicoccus sp.]|nr:hypothetical protein [Methanomassiliicoccus sp.]
MKEIILTHSDGTQVTLSKDVATWTEPNGHVVKEDRPLWPPKAYAARLVRQGFHREGWE